MTQTPTPKGDEEQEMTVELKACPFCGGDGYLVWPRNRDSGRIKCLNRDCNAMGGEGLNRLIAA